MSNKRMIQILACALVLAVVFLIFIVYQYWKYINEKNKDAIYIENKKAETKYLYAAYQFFSQWIITRYYIGKIRKKFEIIQPGNFRDVAEVTMKTALKVWTISSALIIIAAFTDISFYMMVVTISLIYIVNSYIIYSSVNKAEIKLLKQCEAFLGKIRHYYYMHGMVDESIYDTLPELENPIAVHAEKIYQTLNSDDLDEAVSKYNDIVPNQFLKTFLALSVTILKFGDRIVEGQSLFLNNIITLKVDIMIDVRKREKINHKLAGLVFLAVIPMFFLKLIEKWAIGNLIELERYYNGAYGIVVSALICFESLLIYSMLNHMKEVSQTEIREYVILKKISNSKIINRLLTGYLNKNYGKTLRVNEMLRRMGESITVKEFIVKRILYSITAFILGLAISITIHHNNRNYYLYNTNNVINLSSAATDKQIELIQKTIVKYTVKYKDKIVSEKIIERNIIKDGVIQNKELRKLTTKEIVTRIVHYQNEYFKWYELIIVLIVTCIFYYVPYWMLLYRKKIMEMSMEDEVIQYQSIILMLMHIERMSAQDILEWIESFAVIFKTSITECLNDYPAGDIKALEELKRKEPFEPFVKIVDNLIMCDKIGIEKAFDEVLVERRNFQAKRQQDNDIYIDNKSAIASFIAFLPCITVVVLYIIVPFVVESLSQLYTYLNQMNTI
ncbi:hypothetical protein [Anaeromicropila herbilytica]|uniref:Uncharacterized protein n=1 Tax=Anaeromicropila herbilytica TaxID=2785025 RepID=A0A7R7EPA1_9FIRM|nr:hypothetical protein [Anaeromicropila herbilytica]BCN32414.1 hypothetical protein bsdtb5_37090 [Anaeromicropila herbilytica]